MKFIIEVTDMKSGVSAVGNRPWARLQGRDQKGRRGGAVAFDSIARALAQEVRNLVPDGEEVGARRLLIDLGGEWRDDGPVKRGGQEVKREDGSAVMRRSFFVDEFKVLTGPTLEIARIRREADLRLETAERMRLAGDEKGAYRQLAEFAAMACNRTISFDDAPAADDEEFEDTVTVEASEIPVEEAINAPVAEAAAAPVEPVAGTVTADDAVPDAETVVEPVGVDAGPAGSEVDGPAGEAAGTAATDLGEVAAAAADPAPVSAEVETAAVEAPAPAAEEDPEAAAAARYAASDALARRAAPAVESRDVLDDAPAARPAPVRMGLGRPMARPAAASVPTQQRAAAPAPAAQPEREAVPAPRPRGLGRPLGLGMRR